MTARRSSKEPSPGSPDGSAASEISSGSPIPAAADNVPGLAEALAGGPPVTAADAHLGLLLAGPEEIAWTVSTRLHAALCRRALNRLTDRSPHKAEEEAMLGALVEAADQLGRAPSMDEFNAAGQSKPWWSAATIARVFGSWKRALAKAGLLSLEETASVLSRRPDWRTGRRKPRYADERLVEVLRWCARIVHGGAHRYVTVRQFLDWREAELVAARRRGEDLQLPSRHQYGRLGSWPEACQTAGLSHCPSPRG